jgi:hypothetical protein
MAELCVIFGEKPSGGGANLYNPAIQNVLVTLPTPSTPGCPSSHPEVPPEVLTAKKIRIPRHTTQTVARIRSRRDGVAVVG